MADELEKIFIEISQDESYKILTPNDLDSEGEFLDEITERVDKIIIKSLEELFPDRDEDLYFFVESFQFPKLYSALIQGIEIPEKKNEVSDLITKIISFSKKYLPLWYNESGRAYFANSHAYELETPKTI